MKIIQSVSIQLGASTAEDSGINLQLLGVPEEWTTRQPTATRFPQAFSKESNVVWVKMFNNESFVKKIRSENLIPAQWKIALNLFMDQCEAVGVAPFSSTRNRVDNSTLISFLKGSRIRLVKFMDETKLLETLRIIRGSQERKYDTGISRFSVRSSATVKSPFKSIEDLWKFLHGFKFVREPNNSFKKIITPNLVVYVIAPSVNRVKVVYSITGCQSIFLGSKYKIPTRKQVHTFCDTVYLSALRSHRIKALGTHTLF